MDEFRSKLDKLSAMSAALEELQQRRDKIDEKAGQVRPEVIQKLKEEYTEKIRQAEESLEPARQVLREQMGTLQAEKDRLDARLEEVRKRLEELDVRQHIGEFEDPEEFERRSLTEREEQSKIEGQLNGLVELLGLGDRLVERREPMPASPVDPPAAPAAEKTLPDAGDPQPQTAELTVPSPAQDDTVGIVRKDDLAVTVASTATENPIPVFDETIGLDRADDTAASGAELESAPPASIEMLHKGERSTLSLTVYPFTIGRSKKNALTIKAEEISRYHSQIQFEKGKFWIEDLGSANGTKLNGRRIQRNELEPEDLIQLGPVRLTFRLEG